MLNILLKNNKGTTMVIFSLMITILAGVAAIILDFGRVVIEKQTMQNAIDSACLAAAQDLPNTSQALDTARDYIELNGYEPNDIVITFTHSNKRINITGTKEVNYTLAKLIGVSSTTIHPEAAAESLAISEIFNYALLSGSPSDRLTLNGSDFYIDGSTHTNYKFVINGSNQTITGACEAVSTITISGSDIDVPIQVPNASYVEMPDFSDIIMVQAQAAGQAYSGNKTFNESNINVSSPIYVDGNVVINGSNFIGKGCILATGNITFNGSNLNYSTDNAVCFYSKNGDITVNGSNAELDGILYAPNGEIILNGSSQTINGRVIANEVSFNGGGANIISGINELESFSSIRTVKMVR